MKSAPIAAAQIQFRDGEPPRSTQFDDIYSPRIGAAEQARHVFLAGNGLPERWAEHDRFAILETGFGLGNNFLATWQAWRARGAESQRCRQLLFASIEAFPPRLDDLRRAHAGSPLAALADALIAAWPAQVAGFHALDFDGGDVQLLLAWGDVSQAMRQLRGSFDAFYLDGFAPARNPQMWALPVLKGLARVAASRATLATWSVAGTLREGLATAGFEVQRVPGIGGKHEVLRAVFAPRSGVRRAAQPWVRAARDVVVIGAGLAGAWAARAAARRGLRVQVLERHDSVAAETSGNPAGLWHGTLHPDDGPHARLHRAAALLATRHIPAPPSGLLRLESRLDLLAMRALIARQALPEDYVRALSPAEASGRAGVPISRPAWHYPGGGAVDPRALVRHLLAGPGIELHLASEVQALRHDGARWIVDTPTRSVTADAVVLAGGLASLQLLPPAAEAGWPIDAVRGQISWCPAGQVEGQGPLIPVSGGGYALRLEDGRLLCGATSHPGDVEARVRAEDHHFNLQRLLHLTGQQPIDGSACEGRVGWRLQTPDRLPIVGAVGFKPGASDPPIDQLRRVPRVPGLFVTTAFGARGISLAALAGELLAAHLTASPWPLEAELAEAIDPMRWQVRAARRQQPLQRGALGSAGD